MQATQMLSQKSYQTIKQYIITNKFAIILLV